ncbi:MAG: hypothetical protein QOJ19_2629, partial [Acidimicrobiia bacterium]|nr:hypothetical protein [Acidimicrobiia bacterium]
GGAGMVPVAQQMQRFSQLLDATATRLRPE